MERNLDLLYEIGTLRFIKRSWVQFLAPQFANVAEHHYRVMWLALVIATREGVKDSGKVIKMALVHDMAESRTGDTHYISRQYNTQEEILGATDMLAGTDVESEVMDLWQEYQQRDSQEAQIVKDADNLDVDLELAEQAAMGNTAVGHAFSETRRKVAETQFYTQTARDMWEAIQSSDPHAWHRQGRNRINSGDWQTP